jgi:serine/threonine-protein kinase RsbW
VLCGFDAAERRLGFRMRHMDTDTHGEQVDVDTQLESTLQSVDRAEELVVESAKKAGINEDDSLSLGMAVRECMVNAVVHGNRYNLNKKVRLRVSRTARQLIVKIADEGEGFELEELPDPLADENLLKHSGRGIFIIREFTDDFQVRRLSPSGTEVTLTKNVA